MIVSRTPYRVSLFGGGTDLPSYFEKYGGCAINFTIDKYIYVIVNKRFDKSIRVSYTQTEIVDSVDEIKHDLIRECLRKVGIKDSVEIVTIGDLPGSSGLGSSSAVTIGTLNALYKYVGIEKNYFDLATEAMDIEIITLNNPIGVQDQLACAMGGLNYWTFENKMFSHRYLDFPKDIVMQMFYTGITRDANKILNGQEKQVDILHRIKEICIEAKDNPDNYIELLRESWKAKRELAHVTNQYIDEYVNEIHNQGGACKILGAGGGGFILTLKRIDSAYPHIQLPLRELTFKMSEGGTCLLKE